MLVTSFGRKWGKKKLLIYFKYFVSVLGGKIENEWEFLFCFLLFFYGFI